MMGALAMRHVAALLLLLAATALADDGGKAPPTRWSHARGPASCSGESWAEPPETFGGIAWTSKARGTFLFTPVVWDGAIFVVDGSAKSAELVALDAETGKPWAHAAVHAPGQPAVYARSVFLVEDGKTIVQYPLEGRTLERQWTYEAGAGASSPRILDGEIYVSTPGALLSLRAGLHEPIWKVAGTFAGELAVRGGHVYAVHRDGGKLVLSAYARTDGKEAASVVLSDSPKAGDDVRVVAGNRILGVLLPGGEGTWALVERKPPEGDGAPGLTFVRTEKLLTDPLSGDYSLLALSAEPRAWTLFYTDPQRPRLPRVEAKDRPDLFESPTACDWLGESCQTYGDWCGDVISNNIFWHARERPEGAPLRKGLRFCPVPARDGLLLFVPADGKSILALFPQEIR
jgi:hypothetical protein